MGSDNYDLELTNPENLDAARLRILFDAVMAAKPENEINEAVRTDLKKWITDMQGPVRAKSLVTLSNWFCSSPTYRNTDRAKAAGQLWDYLFLCRPERLSPVERNYTVLPEPFEKWWTEQLRRQENQFLSSTVEESPLENSQETVLSRYKPLWDSTYIEGRFYQLFEDTIVKYGQVILEGPPGAGKTWVAREFAKWWTSADAGAITGSDWQIVQLHESYSYEDFFQGIRPVLLDENGAEIGPSDRNTSVKQLVYRYSDGIFRSLCQKAAANEDARFVLIIDEINRGKTSRIFGELLYLLEYRDQSMILASGETFKVPPNVYILGTMNTADRSIALVDYALRRRFRFVPLKPYVDGTAPVLNAWLEKRQVKNREQIIQLYCALNKKITKEINEYLVVGHSYFMLKSFDLEGLKEFGRHDLEQIWEQSVLPLISEYMPGEPSHKIEEDYGLKALERPYEP